MEKRTFWELESHGEGGETCCGEGLGWPRGRGPALLQLESGARVSLCWPSSSGSRGARRWLTQVPLESGATMCGQQGAAGVWFCSFPSGTGLLRPGGGGHSCGCPQTARLQGSGSGLTEVWTMAGLRSGPGSPHFLFCFPALLWEFVIAPQGERDTILAEVLALTGARVGASSSLPAASPPGPVGPGDRGVPGA